MSDEVVVAFYGTVITLTGFKAMAWGSHSARLVALMLALMWLATIDYIHGLEYLNRSEIDGYMDCIGATVMAALIAKQVRRWKVVVFWAFIFQMALSGLRAFLPDEPAIHWWIAALRNLAFVIECAGVVAGHRVTAGRHHSPKPRPVVPYWHERASTRP